MKLIIKYRVTCLCIFLLCLTFLSCSDSPTSNANLNEFYEYSVPEAVDDGWQTSPLSELGLSETRLTMMMNYINDTPGHKIHSILIVKNDKLIFEEYFGGNTFNWRNPMEDGAYTQFGRETLHYLASTSKSVTSVLFGIALDQGLLQSVKEYIASYYPGYSSVLNNGKQNITIENLLTMTSGLAWDESTYPYGDSRNNVTGLFISQDPIKFILESPLISQPGTSFHYNSGNTNIIADLIKLRYGLNIKLFAEENLFASLNISQYRWEMIRGDYVFASGGLYLRPRDLAKIGLLFCNKGIWNNQQIISSEWINSSTKNHVVPGWGDFADGYGYQWWMKTFHSENKSYGCFFSAGWGEQYLYVFPQENLIVVMNCGYYNSNVTISPHSLLENFILPAVN